MKTLIGLILILFFVSCDNPSATEPMLELRASEKKSEKSIVGRWDYEYTYTESGTFDATPMWMIINKDFTYNSGIIFYSNMECEYVSFGYPSGKKARYMYKNGLLTISDSDDTFKIENASCSGMDFITIKGPKYRLKRIK